MNVYLKHYGPDLCTLTYLNIVNLYYVYHNSLKLHVQHGCLKEDRYLIIEVSHPTNKHDFFTDYDSNMMSLWFGGDCMPKVLIDNEDLSDSEKSYNDYEEDFVSNVK